MYFYVDNNKKIIFGWSAKCGCTHIKAIIRFLINNEIYTKDDEMSVHYYMLNRDKIPNDIENYVTLLFTRNPYERVISGFLNKYGSNGEFRYLWKDEILSFSKFIDKLIETTMNNDWNVIEKHHFTPQTSEDFDKKILLSKIIKFYDIGNIDYQYIEQLYNKKIHESIMQVKNERQCSLENFDNLYNIYNLHIDEYEKYNIDYKYFYNEELKEKVLQFYLNDFTFFKENRIDYTNF